MERLHAPLAAQLGGREGDVLEVLRPLEGAAVHRHRPLGTLLPGLRGASAAGGTSRPLLLRGAAQERGAGEQSVIGAAAAGIGIVSAITDIALGDAPPRCPPCSTCPPRCVLPFLFCCLSSTVSPRSGPSTSPRRRAWSRRPAARPARRPGAAGCPTCRCGGWRGAAGPAAWEMATMT